MLPNQTKTRAVLLCKNTFLRMADFNSFLFIYLFIYLFNYSFIYLFIHLFIYLFIYIITPCLDIFHVVDHKVTVMNHNFDTYFLHSPRGQFFWLPLFNTFLEASILSILLNVTIHYPMFLHQNFLLLSNFTWFCFFLLNVLSPISDVTWKTL